MGVGVAKAASSSSLPSSSVAEPVGHGDHDNLSAAPDVARPPAFFAKDYRSLYTTMSDPGGTGAASLGAKNIATGLADSQWYGLVLAVTSSLAIGRDLPSFISWGLFCPFETWHRTGNRAQRRRRDERAVAAAGAGDTLSRRRGGAGAHCRRLRRFPGPELSDPPRHLSG